jgi:hypothetical protein
MEHVGDKEAVGGELLRLEVSGALDDREAATAAACNATPARQVRERISARNSARPSVEHADNSRHPLAAPVLRWIASGPHLLLTARRRNDIFHGRSIREVAPC